LTSPSLSLIRDRLLRLAQVARDEFADILSEPPKLMGARLRLSLRDGSFLDVRYPTDEEYSFHWQVKEKVYRINTAPYHPGPTFPRHLHFGDERIVPDQVTSLTAAPEENMRRVLDWVRKQLREKPGD
jgi:hypothetical protein